MILEIEINYSNSVNKFISKNQSLINYNILQDLIFKAVSRINNQKVNIDLKASKGELKGYYRIRKGNIRILFIYRKEQIHIVNVEFIDFPGDIY